MIGNLRNLLLHITGSLAFLVLPFLFSPDGSQAGLSALRDIVPMQRDFLTYVLLLGVFYINYLYLIPKLYLPRKFTLYIMAVAACYVVMYATPRLAIPDQPVPSEQVVRRSQMEAPVTPVRNPGIPPQDHYFLDPRHFFLFCFVILLALALQLNTHWRQTERQKLRSELNTLKQQINPHFLFNSLNTIYALALDRSEQTAEAVVRLSGMMRHVISETEHETVDLGREIGYLLDYVELQRLRFDNALQLDVRVSGEPEGKLIKPLVLMPFIENAFKFGVNPDEASDIRIHIAIEQYTLRLEVYNRKVTTISAAENTHMQDIRDRLQLLYPGKHLLTVRNSSEDFLISLTLQVE